MSNLSGTAMAILWLILSGFCWVTYHRLFDVMYFNLGKGLIKELVGSLIAGFILMMLVCWIWWLVAIILGIIMVTSFVSRKIALAILCAVMIAVVAIVGISVKQNAAEKKTTAQTAQYVLALKDACPEYPDGV